MKSIINEFSVVAFGCASMGFAFGLCFTGAISLIIWAMLFAAHAVAIIMIKRDSDTHCRRLDQLSADWDAKHRELLIERALFERKYGGASREALS
jgi:hypothetical protein